VQQLMLLKHSSPSTLPTLDPVDTHVQILIPYDSWTSPKPNFSRSGQVIRRTQTAAQDAQVSTARCEALKQGKAKHVDRARFIAGMEEQLLIARQARHAYTAKSALLERLA
jgi:hypothetical protein